MQRTCEQLIAGPYKAATDIIGWTGTIVRIPTQDNGYILQWRSTNMHLVLDHHFFDALRASQRCNIVRGGKAAEDKHKDSRQLRLAPALKGIDWCLEQKCGDGFRNAAYAVASFVFVFSE